jgi:hypothetical protein
MTDTTDTDTTDTGTDEVEVQQVNGERPHISLEQHLGAVLGSERTSSSELK